MNWIMKLERKYGKYAIQHLVKYLAIMNAATFAVMFILQGAAQGYMFRTLALIPSLLLEGQIWRLVTFILLPETLNPLWAGLSIYLFYIIGTAIERSWGAFKFNLYYLIGMAGTGIGAVAVGLLLPGAGGVISATYLNLSLFLAFAAMFPNYQLMLFFILPVKVKWLGWLQAAFVLWAIVSSLFVGNWAGVVAPLASFANFLLFFGKDMHRVIKLRASVQGNRRRYFDQIKRSKGEQNKQKDKDDNVRRF